MGSTALFAPAHIVNQRRAPGNTGFPLSAAPSMVFLGNGIQDHRLAYNKRGFSAVQPQVLGWYGTGTPMVASIVPAAISAANIAAAANVVSGTGMALVSASGSGIIALSATAPAQFFTNPGVITAGVAIDALPTIDLFGSSALRTPTTGFYDRATCVGRAISITGVAGGTGGNFLVSGYDIYGFPTTQMIAVAAGANTVNSLKTFKVVTSVVPQFTDAHNYSVGTADIFGFGILATYFGDTRIIWNNTQVTASTGFVTADTTSPATSATGDPRGTYALQSASNGAARLQIYVSPTLTALLAGPTTGLFGQAPA